MHGVGLWFVFVLANTKNLGVFAVMFMSNCDSYVEKMADYGHNCV